MGHYEVLEVLGQGAFGIVAKAFDDSLHRVVAIKLLAPHLATTSPARKRFLREARAAAQVKHENVVQIYAVQEEPIPHLVMEFVEGPTLQQRLDDCGPLDGDELVALGAQIARGLAAAHDKGLIHRDVKPANVLLEMGSPLRAKLSDFGLARTGDDASLTRSGVIAGTPLFMSPEQARSAPLDHRADLFSLGSVLYAMITGHSPFRASNMIAALKRVAEDTPRPIRQIIPEAPAGLCAVVMRLLHKDPARRFDTAQATAEALDHCLVASPPPRPTRRRAYALAAALLLLLAGAGVALHSAGIWPFDAAPTVGPDAKEPVAAPKSGLPPGAIVVTHARDDGSVGSLRWAVNEANAHHGEDQIVFDPDAFAAPQTITLAHGPLLLLDPAVTTITGSAAGVTVSGEDKTRVFEIGSGIAANAQRAAARLVDLTITRGLAEKTGDKQGEEGLGGGIMSWDGSKLDLLGCTLRDNNARSHGGGVFCFGGTLKAVNCTITRNSGPDDALRGGGVNLYGAQATITNCTIAGNTVGLFINAAGRLEVHNTLFAQNRHGALTIGEAADITGDHNLANDESVPGPNSKRGVNGLLGSLGRYGGPTETMPLLTGSPAVDAGASDFARGIPTDQRGRPRIRGTSVDIGAFEVQ